VSISCPSDERAAATERQGFGQTGNPVHVQHAIAGFGLDEPLPRWVVASRSTVHSCGVWRGTGRPSSST
jgi:hypothetical protein